MYVNVSAPLRQMNHTPPQCRMARLIYTVSESIANLQITVAMGGVPPVIPQGPVAGSAQPILRSKMLFRLLVLIVA